MNDLTSQNVIRYLVAIVAGSLAAGLGVLVVQLSGTDPINWRPVLVAALGPIVTGLASMQLTRLGSEPIAAQVDSLKATGVQRRDMVVVSQDEAAPMLAGNLTPMQVQQVSDELERRLKLTPADYDPKEAAP